MLGLHPGRAFDDTYRHFVRRIAEQIAIGLASARAYEQERQRAEALAEIDRAKTAFFSNVSHEFRTPLALMLGPLEEVLPEARERLGPERHEQLVTVRRNALRLLKLVNTLLDFSRIEAGRVQAVYEPTDLAVFTSEIASVFRSAMEKAGLRFSVECYPIAEPVYVDRDMWEKVVSNLLSNAFKFTFEGAVTVTLEPVDGAVELQVRDTGVGIPEDQRERVFERFHRIEGTQARTYEGTGIGLALVQELVKLHGGSVRVDSVLGRGSTFTVTIPRGTAHLPAQRIQAARSIASTASEPRRMPMRRSGGCQTSGHSGRCTYAARTDVASSPARAEPAAKRELILVADDNADMRQYLGTCSAIAMRCRRSPMATRLWKLHDCHAPRWSGRRHDAAAGWIRLAASHSRRLVPRQYAGHSGLRTGGRRVARRRPAGRRRRLSRQAVYGAGADGAGGDSSQACQSSPRNYGTRSTACAARRSSSTRNSAQPRNDSPRPAACIASCRIVRRRSAPGRRQYRRRRHLGSRRPDSRREQRVSQHGWI